MFDDVHDGQNNIVERGTIDKFSFFFYLGILRLTNFDDFVQ